MMQYKGYLGKGEYDADANLLHGEVLGIRDVITFQAKSVDELRAAFRASVDDYLVFCRKRGEQPDKPLSGKVDRAAAASGMSLNTFVASCLDQSVARFEATPKRRGAPTKRVKRKVRRHQKAA